MGDESRRGLLVASALVVLGVVWLLVTLGPIVAALVVERQAGVGLYDPALGGDPLVATVPTSRVVVGLGSIVAGAIVFVVDRRRARQ